MYGEYFSFAITLFFFSLWFRFQQPLVSPQQLAPEILQKRRSRGAEDAKYDDSLKTSDLLCSRAETQVVISVVLHFMDPNNFPDEKNDSRLYVGNLDLRITEAALIKMFSPFGKIVSEDFLWHTRGPKRGEPRGFAFIQYSSKEEAKLAKEKMHGRLACGRPLVVRLASEKYIEEATQNSSRVGGEAVKIGIAGSNSGQMSRNAKITAIKNKLKALEEERGSSKKQKLSDITSNNSIDHPSNKR